MAVRAIVAMGTQLNRLDLEAGEVNMHRVIPCFQLDAGILQEIAIPRRQQFGMQPDGHVLGGTSGSFVNAQDGVAVPPWLQGRNNHVGMRYFQKPPPLRQVPSVRPHLACQERMIELHRFAVNPRRTPVACVRQQTITQGARHPQLQACVRGHAQLITAAKAVGAQSVSTQQGHHQSAIGYQVSGQADVQQGKPLSAIAVIDPLLGREFDGGRPLDGPKRDGLNVLPGNNGGGEEGLVANELFVVNERRPDVDAPLRCIESQHRRKRTCVEGMPDLEFGKDRASTKRTWLTRKLRAELRLAGARNRLLLLHGKLAATV
jgi:hypothetical protein